MAPRGFGGVPAPNQRSEPLPPLLDLANCMYTCVMCLVGTPHTPAHAEMMLMMMTAVDNKIKIN